MAPTTLALLALMLSFEAVGCGADLHWLDKHRRLSKDHERESQTSETLIQIAMIRLMLARLAASVTEGRNTDP